MIMLGIDPGSQVTGWGVVERQGSRLLLHGCGTLRPGRGRPLAERLARLQHELVALLARFGPTAVGMEAVFHGPNTRSLVTLGQARGALLASIGASGLPLVELTPAEVKKAVVGRGGATKDQVAHMVGVLLGVTAVAGRRPSLDATDALAVAIASLHRSPAVRGGPGAHRTRAVSDGIRTPGPEPARPSAPRRARRPARRR